MGLRQWPEPRASLPELSTGARRRGRRHASVTPRRFLLADDHGFRQQTGQSARVVSGRPRRGGRLQGPSHAVPAHAAKPRSEPRAQPASAKLFHSETMVYRMELAESGSLDILQLIEVTHSFVLPPRQPHTWPNTLDRNGEDLPARIGGVCSSASCRSSSFRTTPPLRGAEPASPRFGRPGLPARPARGRQSRSPHPAPPAILPLSSAEGAVPRDGQCRPYARQPPHAYECRGHGAGGKQRAPSAGTAACSSRQPARLN